VALQFHDGDWIAAGKAIYRPWFVKTFGLKSPDQDWIRRQGFFQMIMIMLPEGNVNYRFSEIPKLARDGLKYGVASVCIPPSYVRRAAKYLSGKLPVCTVIGFPNGYSTTAVKCYETKDAIYGGASEIDMVINLTWVKDGLYEEILREIKAVKEACGNRILKVIVETCLLTEEEKIRLCLVVSDSGAD
jgi:deoxyribose-phosphate aldolase